MPAQAEEEFGTIVNTWLRTHRYILSIAVFAGGIVLSTLAFGDFTPASGVWPFSTINTYTDGTLNGGSGVNYNLGFVILGPIIALIGAYLVGAYILARRKFEHLMITKSKAEFLRNIPELEQLLWDLTPADETRYLQKLGDLRIRR
jgi:hypothetical protein